MAGIDFTSAPQLMLVLFVIGLAPFIAVMVTSYVKLVVVFSLLRNALGIQQVPPNLVLNGLAIILSVYIMYPVIQSTTEVIRSEKFDFRKTSSMMSAIDAAAGPMSEFLYRHSRRDERSFFIQSARRLWPATVSLPQEKDLLVLIPAFTVSELTAAFEIGFFIYVPFIVVDLVVSNVLLAMGMMMVSPITISTPIKLLLFVLLNGWGRLIHGLVLSYA